MMTRAARTLLGIGVVLTIVGRAGPAAAQEPPPPPLGAFPGGAVGADPGAALARMAEGLRGLRREMGEELGRAEAGRYAAHDAEELDRAVDDLRQQWPAYRGDVYRARRQFTGIDAGWRHLRARLVGPGLGAPGVIRAAGRVDEADAELVAAFGMNAAPPDYYGGPAPVAPGPGDARRLARALVDRAEALAAAARSELAGRPGGGRLSGEAQDLAVAADRFHDGLEGRPGAAAGDFAAVVNASAAFRADLEQVGEPPATAQAWRGYRAVEDLLRAQLSGQSVPAQVVAAPAPVVAAPNIVGWADELLRETDGFLGQLQAARGRIPEWDAFMIDTQRLRAAAGEFRERAGRGADIARMANEFREVDVAWQRLSRRLYRVSRGQQFGAGPEAVKRIGATCAQIHEALGMPGYAPID